MSDRCAWCKRPLTVCRRQVNEWWPTEGREAFARAGLTEAATCPRGEAMNALGTGGWCYSRARRHPGWSGPALSDGERRGIVPEVCP